MHFCCFTMTSIMNVLRIILKTFKSWLQRMDNYWELCLLASSLGGVYTYSYFFHLILLRVISNYCNFNLETNLYRLETIASKIEVWNRSPLKYESVDCWNGAIIWLNWCGLGLRMWKILNVLRKSIILGQISTRQNKTDAAIWRS